MKRLSCVSLVSVLSLAPFGASAATLDPAYLSLIFGVYQSGSYHAYKDTKFVQITGDNVEIVDHGDATNPGAVATAKYDSASRTISLVAKDPAQVSASSEVDLSYHIQFSGQDGPVQARLQSKGEVTSNADNAYIDVSKDFGDFGSIYTRQSDYPCGIICHSFNTNNELLTFEANQSYTVHTFVSLRGNGSGYVDPFFELGSEFTDYTVLTSPGVSNSVSAVPLPSSAPMFGAAMIALGLAGVGMKRRAART